MDVSPSEDDRIHYVELMTCAEYSDLCIGMPSDRSTGIALYTDNHQMHKEERLKLWPTFQEQFLAKRGSTFADEQFDYVIHHQVSTRFIKKIGRFGEELFETPMPESLAVVSEYGNTSSTSHFIVLNEHLKSRPGGKFLLVPAASGVVTGCVSATIPSLEA
jgi:3-oxoacyl-[acyl-carrier-protein] synthase-3